MGASLPPGRALITVFGTTRSRKARRQRNKSSHNPGAIHAHPYLYHYPRGETISERGFMHWFANSYRRVAAAVLLPATLLLAADVDTKFHNAPASARATKNPYEGDATAVQAGKRLYARNCLSCHGITGKGTGNVPPLV